MMADKGTPQCLADVAARLGGELGGDGAVMISGVASLESAGAGQISFATHVRHRAALERCRASAVIVPPALAAATDKPRIVCHDPYLAYARVAQLFDRTQRPFPGIHPSAVVEPGARVAADASIGAGAFIGEGAVVGARTTVGQGTQIGARCSIGEECIIHPRVTVYPDCVVGDRGIVHSGAVIGADGFGFAPDCGTWVKIPQMGRVVIGNDVEIGANSTIDRGALDDTVIEDGVKLDNQVQVAHNVRIGAHTAIAAMTGIAGSAVIGRHCMIGGAARIMGHITIADRVLITATSFVSKSIGAAGNYSGAIPAAPSAEWLKSAAWLRNLDRLAARVRDLERRLAAAQTGNDGPTT
jgi:UDP-3-O-[3-hydroxymyristoyl] glucosamine N-acyltransferase